MEKALKKHLPNGEFYDVKPSHRNIMQKVRGKGNRTTEKRLRAGLVRAGIQGWKLNYRQLQGCPDFYFPSKKMAIFVDGCFWHGCPLCGHIPKKRNAYWQAKIERNRERDREKNRLLEAQGVLIMRFWEHELTQTLRKCVNKVRKMLKERRSCQ